MTTSSRLEGDLRSSTAPGRATIRVFVSSTWEDLQAERRAVEDALARMPEFRFVGMEHFGSRADGALDGSLLKLSQCELYIGLVGRRYGSGITEAEYDEAVRLGLPCHVYMQPDDAESPVGDDALRTFRAKVRRSMICAQFSSPAQLGMLVATGVHTWLGELRIPTPSAEAVRGASAGEAPSAVDRERLRELALRMRRTWIDGVLRQSVADPLPLPASSDLDLVDHPWQGVLMRSGRKQMNLEGGAPLSALFVDVGRSLLILGEPGSGKTTTLLTLADELLDQHAARPGAPLPIVFNLSLWRRAAGSFADWLIDEMQLRYGVPKALGRRWLGERRLLPLLDGLDEVAPGQRGACVEIVNDWLVQGDAPGVVVCCRMNEYLALPRLKLLGALSIQPLDRQRIDAYLVAAGPALDPLRRALEHDSALLQMAETPLMLGLMRLTATGDAGLQPRLDATGDGRRPLFDAFIDLMFARRSGPHPPFEKAAMLRWLAWLAERLQAASVTMVTPAEMQPWLLESRAQRGAYFLISRGVIAAAVASGMMLLQMSSDVVMWTGASAGLTAAALDQGVASGRLGLLHRPLVRVSAFLASALCLAMFIPDGPGASASDAVGYAALLMPFALILAIEPSAGSSGLDVSVPAHRRWSGRSATRGAVVGSVLAFVVTASGCASIAGIDEPSKSLLYGGSYAAIGLVVGFVFGGWRPALEGGRSRRLGAIRRALPIALLLGATLAACVYAELRLLDLAVKAHWLPKVDDLLPRTGVPWLIGILTVLWFGGSAAIKHAVLRSVLVVCRLLPVRVLPVLEHAVSLALMRRVDDSYIFMHRALLEHLAHLPRVGR